VSGGPQPSLPESTVPMPEAPAVTLPARTPAQETRAAMAVVDELHNTRDVPIRDILVVVRNLDAAEQSLVRAAIRHDLTPTIWTHLPLADTSVYALCRQLCDVLAAQSLGFDRLCAPLKHGWCPPASTRRWPMRAPAIRSEIRQAPRGPSSLVKWRRRLLAVDDVDPRLGEYLSWLTDQPRTPSPSAAVDTVAGVLDCYRDDVLPAVKANDDPSLRRTERHTRALVRMEELLSRIEHKYDEWLRTDRAEQSWETVGRICELLATQYPGRREHGNARALDIIAANDAWGRTVPYVVAVGLSDGVWPQLPATLVPARLQQRLLAGTETLAGVAPRAQWDCLRQYDQFAETVTAATAGLILTRHRRTHDGIERAPSPLLETIDTEQVPPAAVTTLVSADRQIPDALTQLLPDPPSDADAGHRPDSGSSAIVETDSDGHDDDASPDGRSAHGGTSETTTTGRLGGTNG
jgi:ATP-dependent helicase/nuclease subunit B